MQSRFKTKKQLQNERGFVLISSMLFLILLTTIGIMATDTTNVELQIASNDRMIKQDFYNQEMGLAVAKIDNSTWAGGSFATDSNIAAYFPPNSSAANFIDDNENGIDDRSEITNSEGELVSIYKARKIVSPAQNITTWEDQGAFGNPEDHPANMIPVMQHKGDPPIGRGYDPAKFYVRRYAITAYSPRDDRKIVLQEGLFRAFSKN
jgi:hypothetical protein